MKRRAGRLPALVWASGGGAAARSRRRSGILSRRSPRRADPACRASGRRSIAPG